jgi:hypothetical protein
MTEQEGGKAGPERMSHGPLTSILLIAEAQNLIKARRAFCLYSGILLPRLGNSTQHVGRRRLASRSPSQMNPNIDSRTPTPREERCLLRQIKRSRHLAASSSEALRREPVMWTGLRVMPSLVVGKPWMDLTNKMHLGFACIPLGALPASPRISNVPGEGED